MCCVKSLQSCLTDDPMDHSPPGSSVHGIIQARILEWIAMPSSGDLPDSLVSPCSLCRRLVSDFLWVAPKFDEPTIGEPIGRPKT